MDIRTCPDCGRGLDPGEKCDCADHWLLIVSHALGRDPTEAEVNDAIPCVLSEISENYSESKITPVYIARAVAHEINAKRAAEKTAALPASRV